MSTTNSPYFTPRSSTLTRYQENIFSLFSTVSLQAYRWAMEAVKLLTPQSPAKLVVDVLRQAGESCWYKKEITKGKLLIEQAVRQVKIRTI